MSKSDAGKPLLKFCHKILMSFPFVSVLSYLAMANAKG